MAHVKDLWKNLARRGHGKRWLAVWTGPDGRESSKATGLTAGRVNFLQRRLQVLEQAQNGALAPLKTAASRRTVPVGDWVLEEISAHLKR